MRKLISTLVLSLIAAPAFAEKACEELKSEIAAKLDAKGVKNYQLDIVAADQVKDRKVVGNCESGRKRITYTKGASSTAAPAKESAPAAKGGRNRPPNN